MSEFNQNNPKFIAFVELLNEMWEESLLQKDPDNKNNIIIYRTGLDPEKYGVTEGWTSQNIFDAAKEVMEHYQNGDTELFDALKQHGYEARFTENGEFEMLARTDKEIER